MARGRKKNNRSPRRKFTGVNILNLAEAYVQTSIWTNAAFRLGPAQFIFGDADRIGTGSAGFAGGANKISLREIATRWGDVHGGTGGKTEIELVQDNLGGWTGLAMTGLKTVGVSIGFKVAKKITRKVRSMVNRDILKPLQMGDFVKV
jgi:hypothetical protein